MTLATLDRLIACEKALIAAIDAGEADAIEAGTEALCEAVAAVAAAGAWHAGPELKARAIEALALADAARIRVNVHADLTRQRLELLADVAGPGSRAATYRRDGRLRA